MSYLLIFFTAFIGAILGGILSAKLGKSVLRGRTQNKVGIGSIHSECWWMLEDALPKKKGTQELLVIVTSPNKAPILKNSIGKKTLFFCERNNLSLNAALGEICRKKQIEFLGKHPQKSLQ